MWSYTKRIPIGTMKKEYQGHPNEAADIMKMRFAEECGVVLAKSVNVSTHVDPQTHEYVLIAELITEPQEKNMATMYYGDKKRTPRLPPLPPRPTPLPLPFTAVLKKEIDDWLKI